MRRFFVFCAIVVTSVSCVSEPADTTDTTSPSVSSTLPTPATTSTISPTSTTVPPIGEPVAVYLLFEGYPVAPGPYLAPVARYGVEDLAGALTALLEGPNPDEVAIGLSSTIPDETELIGVEVSEGVALVDLSGEFEFGGGSLSMMGRVAQVVYTATRFQNVNAVRFLLEGEPLDVLGGEGLIIEEPQTREDWAEHLTPPILVEEPMWGRTVGTELEIAGTATVDSGEVSFVIVDADGLIIQQGTVPTTAGSRSQFSTSIRLTDIPNPGLGSIVVWEWASDGSQRHVLEYPITLSGQ